eukprot:s2740_g17.t1
MLTRGVAQVVKSNITGYKRVKAGDPFSQQLGHWDVAVAVHSSTSENTLREASVSLLPERTSAGRLDIRLFDPPIVSTVTEASHAVTAWRHTKVKADFAPMFLPGFPDYLRDTAGQLVSEMARMGAIAGNSRDSALYLSHAEDGVRSKLDAIERLETAGLVDRCFCSEDQSAWLLNLEALQHCTLRLSLDSPRPLFTEPAGLPALTWSRMECLCFLHKHSWDWKFLHDKDEKGSVLPINLAFRVSDDKVIYIFRGVLRQRYLCCLAHVEAGVPLPGGDDVDTICHFESDGYYGQLLGLDVLRKQQQEALMDGPAVPPEAFQRPQDSVEDEILPGPPEAMQPQPGDGLQQKQRMRHHMREDDTDELDDWILSELEKQLNDDPPHPNDSEDEQNDADDAHADSGPADDDDADLGSPLGGGVGDVPWSDDDAFLENLGLADDFEEGAHGKADAGAGPSGSGGSGSDSSSSSSSSSASESGPSSGATEDAPPDAAEDSAEDEPHPKRVRRDETFEWKNFRFTYRPQTASRPAGYMVLCRFHSRMYNSTRCTRSATWHDETQRDLVLRRLKTWCVRAPNYEYQGSEPARLLHQAHDKSEALSEEELEAFDMPALPRADE